MKQKDRWEKQYRDVMVFVLTNHRRPSKYKEKEMKMVNWIKYNHKLQLRDNLKSERREKFEKLMAILADYRRVNQYTTFEDEDANESS